MTLQRPLAARPGGVALLGALAALLTGCGDDAVPVSDPAPDRATIADCRRLVTALPDEVDGEQSRPVSPDEGSTAAWGDPAITVRCGVDRPAGLRPDSFCFVVNDVGWYGESDGSPLDGRERPAGAVVFTTIGRSPYVEVTVPPDESRHPVDPLTDVAAAVLRHTRSEMPCQ